MDDEALLDRLQTDLNAIEALARVGVDDLARAVPACGGWTVADVLGHLGVIESWVGAILRTRSYAEEPEPEPDPERAAADFRAGVGPFLSALRGIAPDEPCWTFGAPPPTARFWIRRQAHEHAVHRFDLESAFDRTPGYAPAFAADGVDEVLTMFYPRQVRPGRTEPVTDPVRFVSADTGDSWQLADGEPAATVTADATTLYLGLWKRRDLIADASIEGDHAAVRRTLARALTP